jgi:hypothetical protein
MPEKLSSIELVGGPMDGQTVQFPKFAAEGDLIALNTRGIDKGSEWHTESVYRLEKGKLVYDLVATVERNKITAEDPTQSIEFKEAMAALTLIANTALHECSRQNRSVNDSILLVAMMSAGICVGAQLSHDSFLALFTPMMKAFNDNLAVAVTKKEGA